jgi:hypothetical protein
MFPKGFPRLSAMATMSKSRIHNILAKSTQRTDESFYEDFAGTWHNLVSDYSKCDLTYSDDKLSAFAGVAKCIMKIRTDQYVSSMWKKSMVYDLAWHRSSMDCEAFPISATSSRAPSWSWASVMDIHIFRHSQGAYGNALSTFRSSRCLQMKTVLWLLVAQSEQEAFASH